MRCNMGIVGNPLVTITLISDDEENMRVASSDRKPEDALFFISRDRLTKEIGAGAPNFYPKSAVEKIKEILTSV